MNTNRWIEQPYDGRIYAAILSTKGHVEIPPPYEPSYVWWYNIGIARLNDDTRRAMINIERRYQAHRKELRQTHAD